jgi:glycosyltransferase involved in cell wall biosynthesis
MRVVCVVTATTLAQARVMAGSLRRHHPEWELELALVGRGGDLPAKGESWQVTSVEESLGLDAEAMLSLNSLETLVRLLVPRVLREHAHRRGGPVIHVPAGAVVMDTLAPLVAPLEASPVVLVPRAASEPPADDLEPSRRQFFEAGRISPELMGLSATETADAFLEWWIDRLDRIVGSPDGRQPGHVAEDRGWAYRSLDLAPMLFDAATVTDPGCNLSAWNLHEQALEWVGDRLMIDGARPVRLFDLSGFDPRRPYVLSPISTRVKLSHSPVLRELAETYAEQLLAAGWGDGRSTGDVGRRLANGIVYDEALERLHAQARMLGEDMGDVFTSVGTERFMAWLKAPAVRGAAFGVNRYLLDRALRERGDVVDAFPDLDHRDGPGFVDWCLNDGRGELQFPDALLPGIPAPPTTAHRAAEPDPGIDAAARRDGARGAENSLGVRVTGYMGHVLGLGSAARSYARALTAAGVEVSTVSVALDHVNAPTLLAADYGRHSYDELVGEGGHGFELVCVNPDELPGYVSSVGPDYFRGPRIGVWGWEVNTIPGRWSRAFPLVDEIWVYSRFVAENLGAVASIPVTALPPPVSAPAAAAPLRLDVPDGFLFLFIFDYMSTIQRKNPVGLIEAFRRAFAAGEGPRLLIKTINAPLRPQHEEALRDAARDRPDIHIVDRSLTVEEMDGLIAGCDCYASLHRSEGFGLTMAEAMAVGKPVIATAYSGNVDFMNRDNSLLVDYELTRVGAGVEIYPPEGEWAQPSIEHAAALMRQVYDDPDAGAALGTRAREDIARTLSPQATGAAMRGRLMQLAAAAGPGLSRARELRRRLRLPRR